MIRHIILFKVNPDVSEHLTESAIKNMCALKDKLPGILEIVGGQCQFHNEKSTHFFSGAVSHSIIIDFEDKNALNTFFNDPITHPAKNDIVNIAEGEYAGIVGFDLNKST
jgi:uncharacterized protein (DUF1330 family)